MDHELVTFSTFFHMIVSRFMLAKMCIAFCLTTDLQLPSQDLLCWRVSNLSYMACSWVAEQAHHNQNFAADTASLDSPFPQRSHYKPLAPSESNGIWEELLTHACKPKPHAALWRVPRRHIPTHAGIAICISGVNTKEYVQFSVTSVFGSCLWNRICMTASLQN